MKFELATNTRRSIPMAVLETEQRSAALTAVSKMTSSVAWTLDPVGDDADYGGPLSQDNNAVGLSFALDFTRSGSALPRFCL